MNNADSTEAILKADDLKASMCVAVCKVMRWLGHAPAGVSGADIQIVGHKTTGQ